MPTSPETSGIVSDEDAERILAEIAARKTTPDTATVEQAARELLAAEYDKMGDEWLPLAKYVRSGSSLEYWSPVAQAAFRAISTALRSRSDLGEWRTIDTIRRDGRYVILWHPNEDDPADRVTSGFWDSFGPYEKEMGAPGKVMHFADTEPTHWMDFPATPITTAGDRG